MNPTYYRSTPFPLDTAIDLVQSFVPPTLIQFVKSTDAIHRIGDHVHAKEKETADVADTQHTWIPTTSIDHTVDHKHVHLTTIAVHLADPLLIPILNDTSPDIGAEPRPERNRIRIRLRQPNPVPYRGKSRRIERHHRPNQTHLIQLQPTRK